MSALPLPRFWTTVGSYAGTAADMRTWQRLVGAEFTAIRPFLVPQGQLEELERTDAQGATWIFRVVIHGPRAVIGICDETGERLALDPQEIVTWTVDQRRLATALADGLGLEPAVRPVDGGWHLGRLAVTPEHQAPVFLLLTPHPPLQVQALHAALAEADGPAVLLTSHAGATPAAAVRDALRRRSEVIPLADRSGLTQGRIVVLGGPDRLVSDLRIRCGWQEPTAQPYRWVQQGATWSIRWEGTSVSIPDQRGLGIIATLLAQPDRAFPAVDLSAQQAGTTAASMRGGRLAAVTSEARRDLYQEVARLQERLAAAQRTDDDALADRTEQEIEQLLAEIERTTALGGDIRVTSDADRARQRIRRQIERAIAAIAQSLEPLADHLRTSVQTGLQIRYSPARHIPWDLA